MNPRRTTCTQESPSKSPLFPWTSKMLKSLLLGGFLVVALDPVPKPSPSFAPRSVMHGSVGSPSSGMATSTKDARRVFEKVLVDQGVLFVE
jgi:hypothetical protein